MKLRSNFTGLDRESLTLYWRLSPHVWYKFVYGTHPPSHTAAPSGSYGKEKQCGAVKCGINSLVLQSRWPPSNSKVVPAQRAAPWWPKQSENCVLAERGNITLLNFKSQAGSKPTAAALQWAWHRVLLQGHRGECRVPQTEQWLSRVHGKITIFKAETSKYFSSCLKRTTFLSCSSPNENRDFFISAFSCEN